MKFSKFGVILGGAALMLGGCASVDRTYGAAPEYEVSDLAELPAPTTQRIFRLGPQQRLEIAVAGIASLSGTFLTDTDGNLDFPLVGNVPVTGLSPSEASLVIADRLRGEYLRNPQVRVIPTEMPGSSISVGGQVDRPGSYPASDNLTLLRAINQAGGLGEYAKLDDVLIMRTIGDQSYIGVYNIGAIQRGNYADPALYADDIIMVGDSPARRRFDRILGIITPLLSTSAVVLNIATR